MTTATVSDQRKTAFHEVGHAVAAYIQGLKIDRLEVWAEMKYLPRGRVKIDADPSS